MTTSATKALRHFYEQTRQVNLLSGLALFLIVFTTVAPLALNPFLVALLKLVAAGLLGRAVYVTFTETQRLQVGTKGTEGAKGTEGTKGTEGAKDIKGTEGAKSFLPTLSYILCGLLSLLLIYTLYMVVF